MARQIGIAWYREEEWGRLLQTAADPRELEETYEQWLEVAAKRFQEMKGKGYSVQKVDIGVEELLAYCRKHKLPLDGSARARYTADKLRSQHLSQPQN